MNEVVHDAVGKAFVRVLESRTGQRWEVANCTPRNLLERLGAERFVMLAYIRRYALDYRYAPSYDEIAEVVKLNTREAVLRYLRPLREMGYVDWLDGQPRTIHTTPAFEAALLKEASA